MDIGKLKSIEYYVNLDRETAHLQGTDGRCVTDVWSDFAGPQVIGNMSKFYAETRPSSASTFYQQYVRTYGANKLISVAEAYRRRIGRDDITYEICFDLVVYHTIIQTIKGKKVEDWISKKLRSYGFFVESTKGKWDTDFNVDLFVCKNGKIQAYLQIKPASYFYGSTPKLIETRKDAFRKEAEKRAEIRRLIANGRQVYTDLPTIYMAYDYGSVRFSGNEVTDIKWAYIGDRVKFRLNDLCYPDGKAKCKWSDFTFKELEFKK